MFLLAYVLHEKKTQVLALVSLSLHKKTLV